MDSSPNIIQTIRSNNSSSRTICAIPLDTEWISPGNNGFMQGLEGQPNILRASCTGTTTISLSAHFYNELYCYILLYLTMQHVGSERKHDQRFRVTLESTLVRDFCPGLIDLKATSWENTHEQSRARNLHHNMMQQCPPRTSMRITMAAGQGTCQ